MHGVRMPSIVCWFLPGGLFGGYPSSISAGGFSTQSGLNVNMSCVPKWFNKVFSK
jgi:hypothetical protein